MRYDQWLEVPGITKLEFLKAVSVFMIAYSE